MSRISKETLKEKQVETLDKMKENRYQDMVFLRDIINKKLVWALAEHKKGLENIEEIKKQVTRLEGVILILKELANKKSEVIEKKKPDDNS